MLTILTYNENKVKDGKAKCILENRLGAEASSSVKYKSMIFEEYERRNHRAKVKSVHISLNFHPGEKLSERKLQEIASEYMERIGFGDQPYLVYQHFDVDHPHIHIVTTKITRDGERIGMHHIATKKSEPARKAIEEKYGLAKATPNKVLHQPEIRKVLYGKMPTKKSISDVVREVIRSYKFTSLPEFNAVLMQFNVLADRGSEESRMFKHRGLVFRVLNDHGEKVGVPVKASILPGKPILPELEKHFNTNELLRRPHKERLIGIIDEILSTSRKQTTLDFSNALNKHSVLTYFRTNDEGRIYGITFVDNKSKVVFNGSDLGKRYGAKAILERLVTNKPTSVQHNTFEGSSEPQNPGVTIEQVSALENLIEAKQYDFSTPQGAMKIRKKRRRRR